MILLSKNGTEETVSPASLQKWTGATYAPYLEFATPRAFRIARKYIFLTQEQVWLSKYFEKEILHPTLPAISLRWIDDRIGWGVFAEKNFGPMEFIAEYTGVVRKRKRADRTNAYCFEYLASYLIDAQDQGGLSRYINHSDTPNLSTALIVVDEITHIVLYTKGAIRKGEELRYDYGPDYWRHRAKQEK